MRKKWILLCSLLAGALPLCAQEVPEPKYPISRIYQKITVYLFRQQKLPWTRALQRRSQAAMPTHNAARLDYVSPLTEPQLTATQQQTLGPRLNQWKQALQHHDILRTFLFKIPAPDEAQNLTPQQADFLTHFLQNGITVGTANPRYLPAKTEEFKHYFVRLTLQAGPAQKPFYLIVNCFTREVFLGLSPTLPGIPLEPLRAEL